MVTNRGVKYLEGKIYDKKLRLKSSEKGGFGESMSKSDITAANKILKDNKNLSPGQVVKKIPAKKIVSSNINKADSTFKAEKAASRKRWKEAEIEIDKGFGRAGDKSKLGANPLDQYNRARLSVNNLKSRGAVDSLRPVDQKKLASSERIMTDFENKYGLKRGDVPDNIYGRKSNYKLKQNKGVREKPIANPNPDPFSKRQGVPGDPSSNKGTTPSQQAFPDGRHGIAKAKDNLTARRS